MSKEDINKQKNITFFNEHFLQKNVYVIINSDAQIYFLCVLSKMFKDYSTNQEYTITMGFKRC